MQEWLNLPWREMILACTALLGTLICIILLINKYPSSRYLGKLVIIGLLYLVSFAFDEYYTAHYLIITAFSVALFHYSRAFFIQNTRISAKHIIPIIVAGLVSFIPNGEVTSILIRLLISTLSLFYLVSTIKYIKSESKSRGIDWFQNPGSRLIWFRNFVNIVILLTVSWLVVFDSITVLQASGGILILLGFVYYQVIKESAFLAPIVLGNKYKKSTLTADQKYAILSKDDVW